MAILRFLFLFLFLLVTVLTSGAANSTTIPWRTLSGNAPIVIAKGGFSGLFPDSSLTAYKAAVLTSLTDVIFCFDVQLTKDGFGICAPDLLLDNCTDIATAFNGHQKNYPVNGVPVNGYFSVDYTLKDLSNLYLKQVVLSCPFEFDGINSISTVEEIAQEIKSRRFWLNIQHDLFFAQHNLSVRSFVSSVLRRVIIDYISSPEVGFLKSIAARFKKSRTKLIFRFLGTDNPEPSTNQTYATLLKNLTFIKTFTSGILIPKYYIWSTDSNQYLLPHSSVVLDAHRERLEVYASNFENDVPFSYNYSYDPLAESLSYIDNGDFSVDGLVTGFPITPSEAIGCFAHINISSSDSEDAKPVIISHNGASGIYAGSTDLAYQQAVSDGADIIDCSVQMTSDGVPICVNSVDLVDGTTVVQSPFNTRLSSIPEIHGGASGIFTFILTWSEIKSLNPLISNPYLISALKRNPAYATTGIFMMLVDFLTFAKDKPIAGILINIENAAYLAEKQGFSITDSVLDALSQTGYNNQTRLGVMVQSTNISVLSKFKQLTNYKRMYMLDESIGDALNSSLQDNKQYADSVAIKKFSIYPTSKSFMTGSTDLVAKIQSFGLSVYVYLFRNEFMSQAWDFFSDPTVEINSYVQGAGVDGIFTDFPGTARRYRRNACLNMGKQKPDFMKPVEPGSLLQVMTAETLPPIQAPLPILKDSDVDELPLPAVSVSSPRPSAGGGNAPAPTSSTPSGQPRNGAASMITCLAILLLVSLRI
ncbi:Glycerophosphoryl diester phosphodiesterase [Cinnamomum micranthum f. kanehirae]|uniref:glycerophosphodiester phosphodiesterase n=1 Tax=Cinnamomum micranthum f. kanehirae TaxID=337451 RepID=A0A3S3NIW7_9MAGN|nr:Glycerophosphoryl diester phosphodiesterase [Cinnamomum micranthum f. kanehirae]